MFNTIRNAINTFGLLDGIIYLCNQSLVRMSKGKIKINKYYLYAQPIKDTPFLAKHRLDKYKLIELRKESVDIKIFGRPSHIIQRRYEDGGRCIGCFKGDLLLGYIWFAFNEYREDMVRCVYLPEPANLNCWDYDIYIEPKYRIGFVFLALWSALNNLLIEDGYQYSLSRISAFSLESIKSHTSLGAFRIGTLLFITVFKCQLFISSKKPFVHLTFSENSFPRINVRMPE